ncbi:hypothetical protein CEXT_614351 [Caerostris extrusa]|uniref:Uncharacterized protein n=1 Tax=Caerostris extrusa TaxID=172846 RepID=A0AAV4QZL4_CAEEX|nr:hypothetical protein CEXT_614351 [Caerostris extrusa]
MCFWCCYHGTPFSPTSLYEAHGVLSFAIHHVRRGDENPLNIPPHTGSSYFIDFEFYSQGNELLGEEGSFKIPKMNKSFWIEVFFCSSVSHRKTIYESRKLILNSFNGGLHIHLMKQFLRNGLSS